MANTDSGGDALLPDDEFTPEERKRIRRIIRDEDRAAWLWRTLRIWVGYGSAALTALWMSWDYIIKVVRALVQAKTGTP